MLIGLMHALVGSLAFEVLLTFTRKVFPKYLYSNNTYIRKTKKGQRFMKILVLTSLELI